MAIAAGTVWAVDVGATAANVNGAGFNILNSNFSTNLTTDSNTGNTASPVVSSASYNFVAADVGNWVYIKSGTNWTPGWYKIASVAANKATLNAAIGAAVQISSSFSYSLNTVVGCSTVGTPTSGTWAIDYSQSTACNNSTTNDLASTNGTTNPAVVTSASYTFGVNTVGNIIHVTAGTSWTPGWYEIVSVSGGAATLDRAVGSSASISSGTWRIGGAASLADSTDDAFFENAIAGNRYWVKGGSYTLGSAVTISAAGSASKPILVEGFNTIRSDRPTGTTRPLFTCGSSAFTLTSYWELYNMRFTSSNSTNALAMGINSKIVQVKIENTSSGRTVVTPSTDALILNCELLSNGGICITNDVSASISVIGCYIHDGARGITHSSGGSLFFAYNIMENFSEYGIGTVGASLAQIMIIGNTFYGAATPAGIGIKLTSGTTDVRVINNIIYGWATGVSHADVQTIGYDNFNDYYNNTADVSNWIKGANDLALNPQFVSAATHNFAIGPNLRAAGIPSAFPGDLTTGYTDIGAVQRQEWVGGSFTFVGL